MPALTRAALKRLEEAQQVPAPALPSAPENLALTSETSFTESEESSSSIANNDARPDTTSVGSDSEGLSDKNGKGRSGVDATDTKRVNCYPRVTGPSESPLRRGSTSLVAIRSPSNTGEGIHTRWMEAKITTARSWLNDMPYTVQTQVSPSDTLQGTHTKWTYSAPSPPSATEESRSFVGPVRNARPQTIPPAQQQRKYLSKQVQPTPYGLPGVTPAPVLGPLVRQGTILVDTRGNPVSGLSPLKRGDTLIINPEPQMEESMEL